MIHIFRLNLTVTAIYFSSLMLEREALFPFDVLGLL